MSSENGTVVPKKERFFVFIGKILSSSMTWIIITMALWMNEIIKLLFYGNEATRAILTTIMLFAGITSGALITKNDG